MKRLMKPLLMICGIVFAAMSLVADTETVDGITWNYTVSGGSATIWAPIYPPSDVVAGGDFLVGYHSAISTTTTGAIEIPSSLGGFPVTTIGRCAFSGCSSLTSISIPAFAGSIGDRAFSGCSSLTSITMQGNAPSVDGSAFSGIAGGCIVRLPLNARGYMIANGKWQGMTVEYYGPEFTIDANGALTGVNLNGATGVVIPDGVTSIGENVFKDCASLKSVIIPEGVNEIGYYAFRGCSSLETVSLPSTLTNIVTAAFEYCTSLRSIEIPASVTSIGTWLFNGCTSLVSVVMHEGIPSIPYKMFTGCSSLAEIDIPNGVADIGAEAFRDCRRLKKVTIPDSVASIGDRTFWDCNNLASLSIPDSVTSIGYAAFAYCYDLADVTMGSGVISLGEYVFWRCSGLKIVTMKGDAPSVGNYAFSYVDSSCIVLLPHGNGTYAVVNNKWQGMEVNYYGPNFEVDASGIIWTYAITNGEATLGNGDPKSTAVPKTTSGIVNIPSSLGGYPVKSIGEYAFSRCYDITGVTIPDSVKNIGYWAFGECMGLTDISIPASVGNIAKGAFSGCSSMASFFVEEGNPAYCSYDGLLLSKDRTILMHGINGDVIVPDTVTTIAEEAFYVRIGLTSIEIPKSVTSIGNSAFSGCSGLTSVTIPDSVASIGKEAFAGCAGLQRVYAPKALRGMIESRNVFKDCADDLEIVYFGPEICEVVAKQRYPWNGLVDISFTVTGMENSSRDYGLVVMAMIPDTGKISEASHCYLVRDGVLSDSLAVNANGNYRLLWDAETDLGKVYYENLIVRVDIAEYAQDIYDKVQLWENGPYWATTNIGADNPEDYGYYFWWGDTVGYKRENDKWVASDGSSSNFSFGGNTPPTYGKNISTLQSEGWITADGVLAPEHDAAHSHWGGNWRMPTNQELDDLNSKCDWAWTTINGVKGYIVRGRGDYADNSIFLPFAGSGYGTSLDGASSHGYCWSSVPDSNGGNAWGLSFFSVYHNSTHYYDHSMHYYYLGNGQSVRPVQGFTGQGNSTYTENDSSGDSAPFVFDTVTSSAPGLRDAVSISYDAAWIGGNSGATVVIEDNSTIITNATGVGDFTHTLTGDGRHDLTYITYIGGVPQDDVYTATVFKGWAYEVDDNDGAILVDTAYKAGDVVIPSEIDGHTVTGIVDRAFEGCGALTSVTIPDSVTSIGGYAFNYCRGLTSVTFEGNAPSSVGDKAFDFINSSCIVRVPRGFTGWNLDGSGKWLGMTVEYYELPSAPTVDVDDTKMEVPIVDEASGTRVIAAKEGQTLTADDVAGVKISSPLDSSDITEAYIKTLVDNQIIIELATPEVESVEEEEEKAADDPSGMLVEVEPEKVVAPPQPAADEEVGALPVKAYPGLYYQASWGDDLNSLTTGEKVQATGDSLYLGVIKQKGDKGFYKLSVSEK